MKYSRLIGKTARQHSNQNTLEGYSLLLRAGFIHVLGQGLITYLPMGKKVMENLKSIIAGEMNALGGEEFLAPLVNPLSIWNKSGRSRMKDNPLVTFRDTQGRTLVLSPTHEEAAVELARSTVLSYRDLPLFIYQFQTKFRDEPRTRLGLIRAKEFTMKDAYSFHRSYADLNNFFPKVFNSYTNIFKKCHVPVIPAESGVGIMGGSKAFEFLFPHEQGKDIVMVCPSCGYSANRTVAIGLKASKPEVLKGLSKIETENCSDLDCLSAQLNIPLSKMTKPRVYESEQGPIMAVVRGDYDVSLDKLSAFLGFSVSAPAKDETLKTFNLIPGYISPANPPEGVRVIVDDALIHTPNLVSGDNRGEHYFLNLNFGRDFDLPPSADIALLNKGDRCINCGKELEAHNAFEMGNIFKLDDYYTKRMHFSFENDKGRKDFPYMGSYGLGLGRLITCIAEANKDDRGLVWPLELAPYRYYLMGIGRSPRISHAVDEISEELGQDSVLVDDRIESIGVKFRDAELIGIPLRIVVGRRFLESNELELKDRKAGVKWFIPRESLKEELIRWSKSHVPSV